MTELDLDFVRSQFPAFTDPRLAGWAQLENAGGSYVPRQVIDLLTEFFVSSKVQPYYAGDPSARAGEAMDRAKALLPATLNAEPGEVMLGPSTSQNTYVLAHAIREQLADGDEVIVTNQDHEANIGAWRRMERTGITVKEWQVDPVTGLLDVADLRALLSDRTRLLAVTHASNIAGTVNPVPRARRPRPRSGRADRRRRGVVRPARSDRRARARLRLLPLQRVQDLRAPCGGDVRPGERAGHHPRTRVISSTATSRRTA